MIFSTTNMTTTIWYDNFKLNSDKDFWQKQRLQIRWRIYYEN